MLRRTLALLAMMLLLAGCYRQADDSFQTVNNQGAPTAQTIDMTPTETLLNPNDVTATPEDATPVIIEEVTPTEEIVIIEGGDTATPTVIIIEPPTQAATATTQALVGPTALPTATPPTLITPGQGNPPQVTLPTSGPGLTPTQAPPGTDLAPTPTDMGELVEGGECTYTVANGDNLYRIALRNGVELADLLSTNSLSETSIIQPGELLKIPGCVEGENGAQVGVSTPTTMPGVPQATPFPADVTVHTVASGETLSVIARQYGVSLQSIIDANNLTNPDRLSIGQQLIIPPQS